MSTEENRPRVGATCDDHRAVCAYSLRPDSPQCTAAATLHVRAITVEYGEICMATCDNHAPIARAVGIHRDEHEFGLYCGFPSTRWALTGCHLDVLEG